MHPGYYALDLQIKESGGPEHIERSLKGEALEPANYRFTAGDGTRIVYHACGRGPLLIIMPCPGWGVGMNYLAAGFQRLITTGKVTFISVQTRGTLPSERPADPSHMGSRHMAEDIDDLRRHLGQKRCSVMGHSNGSAIALEFAERFAEFCEFAILIDSQIIGYTGGGDGFMQGLTRREQIPRYREAAIYFKTHMLPAMIEGLEKTITSDKILTDHIAAFLDLYFEDPARNKHIFTESTGPLNVQHWAYLHQSKADSEPEANAFERLHQVKAKCFIASGRQDFICSVGASSAAAECIGAHATHYIYEHSGHMPWIEEADAFFRDLIAFLFGSKFSRE